jgi:DNA topoisomerase-3
MALYDECLAAGQATVKDVAGRPKNKWRPVPLATVELQKRASKYLRIGSETLMSAAEKLYNEGYITYPRTETEKFRPEFDHRQLISEFATAGGDFGAYANKLQNENGFQNPRAGQHDDGAHPPITPAKAVDPQSIPDATERQTYTLIVKHYLACCSRDAVGKETLVTVTMASEEFTAKGLMIVEQNWLEIYAPFERWSTGQGEMPVLEKESRITPSSLLLKDGRTSPPQPISEVELISLMDRNGIGTDATIAQHIATILDRAYATKDGALKFHPTKLGIALVEGYNSMGYQLNKPDLRREMEHECNLVALGRKNKEAIMGPILSKMKECFERANAEAHKLDEAVARHFSRLGTNNNTSTVLQANFSECGSCGNLMALKQGINNNNNNRGNNRNSFPRKLLYCGVCSTGMSLPNGRMQPLMEANTRVNCPICQYQVIKVVQGDGYNGGGYNVCPKCFSDPPLEHGGANTGDFRCFQCQHPTCRLASGIPGGDIEVYKCPFCRQGSVNLRKNSRGFLLSCNAGRGVCDYAVWLPKEASTTAIPENQMCSSCSAPGRPVRKIHFVWKAGSIPPHLDRECTVCVLCDAGFREDMNVRLPRPNQVRTNARAPRGGAGRGRGGARVAPNTGGGRGEGGGGNACFKCGQPGHYANACPQGR